MDSASHSSLKQLSYKPLDASRNEIRVLSTERSEGHGLLRFTLEHVSLDDWKPEYTEFRAECSASWDSSQVNKAWRQKQEPEKQSTTASDVDNADRFAWGDYIAISYRWGNLEETRGIMIDGMPVVIGKNLAFALAVFASKKYKIWADAVCINQDDVAERNAHVMKTRDIYGQAISTLAWLGKDEVENTDLTSQMESAIDDLLTCNVILLGHDRRTLEAMLGIDVKGWEADYSHEKLDFFPFNNELLYFDKSDEEREFRRPHFREVTATALLTLVRDPYWTRLWIIQELAVCSTFKLSWDGSNVPLELIFTLAEIFCDNILDRGMLPSHLADEISPGLHLINTIGQWRKSGVFSKREAGLEGVALDELCRLARSAQCALPHDRVYGLLGLLPQTLSSKITVDYSQDVAELQSAFTALIPAAEQIWADAGDANQPMYVLQEVPGKGKGFVATRKIAKGTRILSEEPIIVYEAMGAKLLQAFISAQVEKLSEDQRQAFLSMHNIHPYKDEAEQYIGILRTNGLPAECDGFDGAIFLEACRINHACDNNAQKNWNSTIQRHTVQAMRDIEQGEEITISYLYPLRTRQERQKTLQDKFAFACTCHLCSLPRKQSQESDRRLKEIRRLDAVIDSLEPLEGILMDPLRTLRYFDQQVRLYQEQGREDVGFAQTLINAANLVIANGDLARGRVLEDWAASVWKTTIGADTTQAFEQTALARDPMKCKTFGMSTEWRTRVYEVPQGLEPGAFQDWLWKREKPRDRGGLGDLGDLRDALWEQKKPKAKAQVRLANLRDTATFPRFTDLPNEDGENADFYRHSDNTCRPRRHWCFLGEIVGFRTTQRLEMELRDAGSETIPLRFFTEKQGKEVEPIQLQNKYTVAVLYADRSVFVPEGPGIRHEDPLRIRIFPLSLSRLLALNDRVQEFSTEVDGMQTCHRCGKKSAVMKACSKCTLFWYCNKACQTVGWKKKGHKADCSMFQDPDLRGLFVFLWDKFVRPARFPLRQEAYDE